MDCSTQGSPVLHYLLEFAKTHIHWVCDAIQSSHTLLPPSLFTYNLSQHQDFFNEPALGIRWSKYWSFSISPSNEYSGLISFRTDWFYLLALQGTLKSLLQHRNVKASVLWHSAFFMTQLSHLYMTTGKSHNFGYTNLCQQRNISAFQHCLGLSNNSVYPLGKWPNDI